MSQFRDDMNDIGRVLVELIIFPFISAVILWRRAVCYFNEHNFIEDEAYKHCDPEHRLEICTKCDAYKSCTSGDLIYYRGMW